MKSKFSKILFSVALMFSCALVWIYYAHYTYETVSLENTTATQLADGFMSFQTALSVEEQLKTRGSAWETVESSKLGERDSRPRFDILVIEAAGYEHLGVVGSMRFEFFNDRLTATLFFPSDMGKYQVALKLLEKVDLSAAPLNLPPGTVISTSQDFKQRLYVSWADTRLENERTKWIRYNAKWQVSKNPPSRT